MNKHLRYVGDQAECHKLAGQGVAFANTVAQQMLSLGIENMEREFYLSPESHIRVKCNKESAIITIYAEPKGYSMKSGLIRSGKIVSGSNGKLAAKDFRDSEYAFQMKHDAWVAAGSQGVEPVREYYNVEDLSFVKEVNDYGHGYPIPSRYTGLMATAIEFAIGANRIVDTSHGWFQTDGIYRDGDTDWMVRINPTGAWARKIQKLSGDLFPGYEDKINNSTLGYVPKELRFPTGDKYIKEVNDGSIIKLSGSVSEFYDSCWSADKMNNQGWCFSADGHTACNISIKSWKTGVSVHNLNMSRVMEAHISINTASNSGSISVSILEQKEVTTLVIPYGTAGPCGPIVQYSGLDDEFGDNLKLDTGGFFWDLNMDNAGGGLYLMNGKAWYEGGSSEIGQYDFPVWCAYVNGALVTGRIGYETVGGSSSSVGDGDVYYVILPDGTPIASSQYEPSRARTSIVTTSYIPQMRYTATIAGIVGQPIPDRTMVITTSPGCTDGGYEDVPDFYMRQDSNSQVFYKLGSAWFRLQGEYSDSTVHTYNTVCHSKISVSMSHTDRLAFFIKRPSVKTTHIIPDKFYTYTHSEAHPGGSEYAYPIAHGLSPGVCNPYVQNLSWTTASGGGYIHSTQMLAHEFVVPSSLVYTFVLAPPYNDCYAVVGSAASSPPSSIDHTSNMHNRFGAFIEHRQASAPHIAGGLTMTVSVYGDASKSETVPGSSYSTYSKMKSVMYVNGQVYQKDTHQDTPFASIHIPGFGNYNYMDGLQFVSYRCSQNSSMVATNYHLASGNMDEDDAAANSIHLMETSADGEAYVDWYATPATIPSGVGAKRCNYTRLTGDSIASAEPGSPQYDEAVRQYELRETVNRQFFGPYIWCGPQ